MANENRKGHIGIEFHLIQMNHDKSFMLYFINANAYHASWLQV